MTPSSHENPIVGIDLGTTSSRVGVWQNDRVQIIPNTKGSYSIPSYVAFTDTSPLVGDAAKAQMTHNPHNTIFGINVLIGRKFSDPEVQQSIKNLPFKVVRGQEDTVEVEVKFRGGTKTFTPVEIVALLLVELQEMAENTLAGR